MISEKEGLDVREPPGKAMGKVAELWKPVEGTNKIMCTACARYCKIGEGQVGLCGIRGVHEGKLWLYVYGRVITGHVDPIEKKPVSHYRPGSKIFSIATTGCNWLCHPAGTPILLHDGSTKPVEQIRAGDALWSLAGLGGTTAPAVVTEAGGRKAARFRSSREPVYSFECVPFHNYVASDMLVHNCRYCFLPNTLVMTESGYQPIESLFAAGAPTENPEVRLLGWKNALTHRNRWRAITKAF